MALVNHTGAIAGNETWAATDEHHITGSVSLNDGVLVTIEAGVTVYYDGYWSLFWRTVAGNCGQVDYNGTEAAKIIFMSDPTNFPRPAAGDCIGVVVRGTRHEMNWVRISHGDFFARILPDADDDETWIHINNCASIHNYYVFENNSATAVTNTQDNFFTIDGFYIRHAVQLLNFGTLGFTGGNLWENIYCSQTCSLEPQVNNNYSQKIHIQNWLTEQNQDFLYWPHGKAAGKSFDFTIDGFFVRQGYRGYLSGGNTFRARDIPFLYRNTEPITFKNGVITDGNRAIWFDTQQAEAFTAQYIDFIETGGRSFWYRSTIPTLIMDSIYTQNCRRTDFLGSAIPGGVHQNEHWYDNDNAQSPTNVQATPLFPLDVENIAEGAPGADSITITYDAKEGSVATKRLLGIPFIKYGTASGGPYGSVAGTPPWSYDERTQTFAKWTTAFGSFATLNHSVTLSNLKSGTTYYYKCCFIDPLGRVAEGAEGTFDTTGSAIVRRDVSPSFSIRRT